MENIAHLSSLLPSQQQNVAHIYRGCANALNNANTVPAGCNGKWLAGKRDMADVSQSELGSNEDSTRTKEVPHFGNEHLGN